MSFLDPQKTKEGKPYGPERYKQIVKEIYTISKILHTSYEDVLNMSPTEKNYLLEFILEDNKKNEEAIAKANAEAELKRKQGKSR